MEAICSKENKVKVQSLLRTSSICWTYFCDITVTVTTQLTASCYDMCNYRHCFKKGLDIAQSHILRDSNLHLFIVIYFLCQHKGFVPLKT